MKQTILKSILIVFGVLLIVSLARGVWDSYRSGSRLEDSESRLVALEQENNKLKEEIASRQSNYFVEKEAREKLNLGKPNEAVVIIPENKVIKEPLKAMMDVPNWKKWASLFLPTLTYKFEVW